jgi:hypothetical protein
MNHVDPSISSGSSPGVMIAQAPGQPRIPDAAECLGSSPFQTITIPFDAGAAQRGDCGIRFDTKLLARMILSVPLRKTSESLWRIIGTNNDTLAYNKFIVFALMSVLLVPRATKVFRRMLKNEHSEKRQRKMKSRLERELQRNRNEYHRGEQRLQGFERVLIDCWWYPNSTAENIPPNRPPFPPPHWHGEGRPSGTRRVRTRSVFPSIGYLTYLVKDLGYDGHAAFAAMIHGHQPWIHLSDRRRANSNGADAQAETSQRESTRFVSIRPYWSASPSRRTHVGGGLQKQKVIDALQQMRTDNLTKEALFRIVYRRHSTLRVSDELGIPAERLYVYATRLRNRIADQDMSDEEKVA